MEKHDGDPDQAEEAGRLTLVLDAIWNEVVLGDSKLSPEKSCFELAGDYRHSGKTREECAQNFIGWQMTKAGAAGFALGLPGFAAMPLTVPADFLSVAYLQLRMVAVIGLLFDWDVRSDQFRTMAYMSLLGAAAGELVRDLGIKATTRVAMGTIQKKVSGAVLQKINRAVSTRLVTKAVPVLGGLVGGGVNVLVTRQIGKTAISWLKEGPPPLGAGESGAPEGGIIEGEIA